MGFKFELGAKVKIKCSGEEGIVKGRGDYLASENCYFLHYKAADGRAVEQWWGEGALTAL